MYEMSTIKSTMCSLSHFSVNILFNYFSFNLDLYFFLCDDIFFGPNSRVVESNFLTKDKTKRQGIKVENAP